MGRYSETSDLSFRLHEAKGEIFEREVLPLIRLIWPQAVQAPRRWTLDRQGIDLLLWKDGHSLPLVVQCKGFEIPDDALGSTQIKECLDSIERFRASGRHAETYVLLHNREPRNERFRESIDRGVASLVEEGCANRAEVWNHQGLIAHALEAMRDHFLRFLERTRESATPTDVVVSRPSQPVEQVPIRVSQLRVDQNRLVSIGVPSDAVVDIASHLGKATSNAPSPTILLGYFGSGKTTAMLESLSRSSRTVLYVEGARIGRYVTGTKDFLAACIDVADVLVDYPIDDQATLAPLIRPVLDQLLHDADTPVALAIDALDESAFLSQAGRLTHLFNFLHRVRVPIVLSMRTEFWAGKSMELSSSMGQISTTQPRRYVTVSLVELLPWTPDEIGKAITQFQRENLPEEERLNVMKLSDLVGSGGFPTVYGDIPTRPLFLRMILETAALRGVASPGVGLAQLFADWVRLKITRDVLAPLARGDGRLPLDPDQDSMESTIEIAWELMEIAAREMTSIADDGDLELLDHCTVASLHEHRTSGAAIDPTKLVVHSLLTLARPRQAGREAIIRFQHRAFQEFFLAASIVRSGPMVATAHLPESIVDWIESIKREHILN